ncbi:ribosome assembly factor SBDS [Candidatus Woesearchaeota archaeon]|nr:ribosome assembly factor SBDS [Candidatus Woesearchaeota archaeon]
MRQTFDKEKATHSVARMSMHGHEFEIVIEPENAVKHRHGEADINSALMAPHVYKSVQSGELASKELMSEVFETSDEFEVASRIIKEGELHFNDEYKNKLRSEKKDQLIALIAKQAADANTGLPLDPKRLQSAMIHANVHVDIFKPVEDQLEGVVAKLRSVISLTLERKSVTLRIPAAYAPKLYGFVASRSSIVEEAWLGDGALSAKVELAAGAVPGFLDELKSATHGDVEASVEKKR